MTQFYDTRLSSKKYDNIVKIIPLNISWTTWKLWSLNKKYNSEIHKDSIIWIVLCS